ncbi:EAL domain-containing protein [Pacificimonas sp. WHA3]|uniref:EAL domain-containing protein n=1 Tax=Pacificimonas pallii TaxID=2827236 RepID=A0ABS6SAG2_9SPHN|nr:EAL domain-containing protein [Pacificimonas pallii]MBV7255383.1 EAL domain-containing protein [Pacificimonas pallii]
MPRRIALLIVLLMSWAGLSVQANDAIFGTLPVNGYEAAAAAARDAMTRDEKLALDYARKAEAEAFHIAEPKTHEAALITSLWLQAEALARMNRNADASPVIEQALTRIEAFRPGSKLHGDILQTRASIASGNEQINQALEDLHQAHNIFRDLGESRGQAITLQNLGMIYWRARDYGRVLNYYAQSIDVYPDDPVLTMSSHNHRGNAHKEMGNYAKAETAYTKSLAVARSLDSPVLEAGILANISSAQFLQGRLDEADATANLGLARDLDNEGDSRAFLWGMKAQIAHARDDLWTARILIERTFEGTDLNETSWQYRDFHNAAHNIYDALNEHENAYRHLSAFGRLEQAAMKAASSTHAALLASKFDAANQELRISKLQADQLRNDKQLQDSKNRLQLMTVGSIIAAAAVLLILSALSYAFLTVRRSHADVTEANDMLTHAARHDALTGLPNRPSFRNLLHAALQEQAEGRGKCALFLVDLDRFKQVNDTLGHAAGDHLLCGVAMRIQAITGNYGHVCRLGGDEFAVIITATTDIDELTDLADGVIADISRPFVLPDGRASVGATIGVAIGREHGDTVDALSRSADLALYSAKDAGRGRQAFYQPAMREAADQRRRLEQDLNEALARGQLSVLYQPIVSSKTYEVEAYEALLRWKHPEHGFISPEIFIPIAEDAGLINRIGNWVLRSACETAMQWPEHVKLAVNLSSLQVESDGLAATVISALSASGLPAARLELEVTESVFLRHGDSTKNMLERLRAIGVELALDDFGTGYSSLGYLHRADFAKIKIDRTFVRAAVDGWQEGVAVIEAIVSLANSLGMATTAEGIESEFERDEMVRLGCTQLQGYYFGRPARHERAVRQADKAKFAADTENMKYVDTRAA